MSKNFEILDRITGQCTPNRDNKLTGANYPYRSAEPDTILFDRNGVAYHATEPLIADWPAAVMKLTVDVEA
jgi:hypothetical protein